MASMMLALIMHARGVTKLEVGRGLLITLDLTYLTVLSIFAYYWLTQPQYYLSITGSPLELLLESSIIFIVGLAVFAIASYIRVREGLPLALTYAEIPPE